MRFATALSDRAKWAAIPLFDRPSAMCTRMNREAAAVHLHGLPGPSPQELLSSAGFRAGVLLLVANTVGFQAMVAHQHLLQPRRTWRTRSATTP